jgi:hypothetical protein
VGRWVGNAGWEGELVHHKLYLENPPPGVEHFEVTHGYNLVTANRAVRQRGLTPRGGIGPGNAHPGGRGRGRRVGGRGGLRRGYFLAGPTLQLGVGGRVRLAGRFYGTAEGKLTASYARVPLGDGSATVPDAAVHGLLGLGYGP